MKPLDPSGFAGLSEADCIQIQRELSARVTERGRLALEEIRTVAGVDTAYWQEGELERAVCCIVVLDVSSQTVIEERHSAGEICFPYIPGCFAFRELPLVLQAAAQLQSRPDVYLFDGNGILHPRGMGLATHASFYLEAPTAGIAKRYFQVEGASCGMPENTAGAYSDIVKDGKVLGRAIRTQANVKPVYASVGNDIDLDTVTKLALRLTGKESHIPMPTRYADLATHRRREALRCAFLSET